MKYLLTIVFVVFAFCSCNNKQPETPVKQQKPVTHYGRNLQNMVRIVTYDVYGMKMSEGIGTYVTRDIIVTPLNWLKGAYRANVMPMDSKQTFHVYGYVAYNLDDNLVALRVEQHIKNLNPLDTIDITSADTLYSLDSKNKKTLKTSLTFKDNRLSANLIEGMPIFDSRGIIKAIAVDSTHVINATALNRIVHRLGDGHTNIYDLRLKTNKVYPSYQTIKGCKIVTTMGNIYIRLYNETPEYRDNFIRLVSDDFYDSLLVHRVLPNYLIQTGAADSKLAKRGDIVGWQGPGYTLPLIVKGNLFHRRGVIAASKLPADRNKDNRCDGSQFYIVAGRKFSSLELDEIEKEYHKKFTSAQREAYMSVGGAPYLDGEYTIFAEVTSGMDVVDAIAAVEVDDDSRPKRDIRVKDIVLIKN